MKSTFKKIEQLYTQNLVKHGSESKAVGWNTSDCQDLRFEKLTSVIQKNDQPLRINDYGCGYGAHLEYLIEKGFTISHYNGYDISLPMLEEAKSQYEKTGVDLNLLQSKDITTKADYTFVSGTFNVRFGASDEEWEEFIRNKLSEINRNSRFGFAFNILTSYVDYKEPDLYYADPTYWFDYVKSNFRKRVCLLHDYPLYEWTLIAHSDDK